MRPDQTPRLFGALSEEFDTLADGIETLAALVAATVRDADDTTRPLAMQQAQAIDEMTQRCRALSDLTDTLSREEPLNDALDAIPLAALANRLRHALRLTPAHTAVTDPHTADPGDLMLFD